MRIYKLNEVKAVRVRINEQIYGWQPSNIQVAAAVSIDIVRSVLSISILQLHVCDRIS